MKKALTKPEILALFCKDMEQPAIQMALYRSFRRYADLRDKLAADYEKITRIPADEFISAYAQHSYHKMEQIG
jgi:predicted signal transduction protein with EAL and GGDEF domain